MQLTEKAKQRTLISAKERFFMVPIAIKYTKMQVPNVNTIFGNITK